MAESRTISSQASSTARDGCASTTNCTPPRSAKISRADCGVSKRANHAGASRPGLVSGRWRAVQDLSRRGKERYLIGANPAALLQKLQHQVRAADGRVDGRQPAEQLRRDPVGGLDFLAYRVAGALDLRGDQHAHEGGAQRRYHEIQPRPQSHGFHGSRPPVPRPPVPQARGRQRRAGQSHENHEVRFMMPLMRCAALRGEDAVAYLQLEIRHEMGNPASDQSFGSAWKSPCTLPIVETSTSGRWPARAGRARLDVKLRVLGSAAGGGFPQWNCNCPNCAGYRPVPSAHARAPSPRLR